MTSRLNPRLGQKEYCRRRKPTFTWGSKGEISQVIGNQAMEEKERKMAARHGIGVETRWTKMAIRRVKIFAINRKSAK